MWVSRIALSRGAGAGEAMSNGGHQRQVRKVRRKDDGVKRPGVQAEELPSADEKEPFAQRADRSQSLG